MKRPLPVTVVLYVCLGCFSAWYVVPFCWAVATSLKHPGMVFDSRWLPYARTSHLAVGGVEKEIRVVEERGDSLLVRTADSGALFTVPRARAERIAPRWSNYADTWNAVPFSRYFLNSLLVSLCVTLGQLVTRSPGSSFRGAMRSFSSIWPR
jgi:ABC-type glycerol-3-phosphate transport system permease component